MSTPADHLAHHEALVRAAQGLLGKRFGGRIDASSIVQEVYLDVLKHQGSIADLPELRVRVRHKVVDAIRRLAATKRGGGQVIHTGQAADPIDPPAATPTPSHDAASRETMVRLDELTELEGAIVRAHYLDGLTYREIAARFNVPLGSVGDRIKNGLLKLRGQLRSREA